jgi:hypothetical protein
LNQGLREASASAPSATSSTARRVKASLREALAKPMIRVATVVTRPALPSSMRIITTRRRTGWVTTASASLVVNPVPASADRAWKRAASWDMPVSTSARVATRVITSEMTATAKTLATASTATTYPKRRSASFPPGTVVP